MVARSGYRGGTVCFSLHSSVLSLEPLPTQGGNNLKLTYPRLKSQKSHPVFATVLFALLGFRVIPHRRALTCVQLTGKANVTPKAHASSPLQRTVGTSWNTSNLHSNSSTETQLRRHSSQEPPGATPSHRPQVSEEPLLCSPGTQDSLVSHNLPSLSWSIP